MSTLRFYAWKVWNRTRYYWPQAQARKRVIANFEAFYAEHGEVYEPPAPWWWPFYRWPFSRKGPA